MKKTNSPKKSFILSDDICTEIENKNFSKNKIAQKTSGETPDVLREIPDVLRAIPDVFCANETEKIENVATNEITNDLCCNYCDYITTKKCDYLRHMKSKRHLLKSNNQSVKLYVCEHCEKPYKVYKSYWYHTNKCSGTKIQSKNIVNAPAIIPVAEPLTNTVIVRDDDSKNNIINRLFLENQELRNFVVEQSKEHIKNTNKLVNKFVKMNKLTSDSTELTNTTNNNNTVNNNNNINNTNNNTINGNVTSNNVNINVFLNDKCKDAVNLTEFIDNVQITNADLENNANSGFVNGISKILIDNLKTLSIYERPIHCTDVKRETMYIKDDHMWSKEEDDKKLKSAIQEISRKIMVQFSQWREDNPDYVDLDSEAGMKYVAITQNSVAGSKRDAYYGKIMKYIAKETVIPR
jgi:hypothetical protein